MMKYVVIVKADTVFTLTLTDVVIKITNGFLINNICVKCIALYILMYVMF
jgi:hypothetical protein